MKAELVYQITQELSNQELVRLYDMLKNDVSVLYPKTKKTKTKILTDKDAINYLLENVFKCEIDVNSNMY